jgi:hypothetical protein
MTSPSGGPSTSSKKSSKKNAPTRRVEGPPALPFEIRRSPIQGLGGFATQRIAKGSRIVEYVGEIITDEEADKRYDDDTMERHHTFLFSLGNGTAIDAAVDGNDARFINHSCAPNCEAIDEEGRIFIEALRDIEPGEELFYDYAYERGGDADEDREEIAKFYACKCGAPTCRGTILAPPKEKKPKKKAAATKQKAAPAKKGGGTTSKAQKKEAQNSRARSKGR